MLDSIGLFILDGNWIAGMMLAIYKMCPVWFAGFERVSKSKELVTMFNIFHAFGLLVVITLTLLVAGIVITNMFDK